jgi:ankyrin repeat protein
MCHGNGIAFCAALWLAVAGAPAFASDENVTYSRLVKRTPPASTGLAEISKQTDVELLAAGFQPIGVLTVLRPELRCDFEHRCADLPEPHDAAAEARKEAARHGAQVLTLPCDNADVVQRTPPKKFFSTLGLEQECRTVPDVFAPGKYKQECDVAHRYWDRTLLRVARGVAWHRSPNEHAEPNLRKGYRLLFSTDPLSRACLHENPTGILRDMAFPKLLSANPQTPRAQGEPRDGIPAHRDADARARGASDIDPQDEIPPPVGQSALIVAAAANDAQALRALLTTGVAADMRVASGETGLHYAAAAGATESIRILLEQRAEVNARNAHGATPLYIGARHGQRGAVALLLDNGALIDDQSLNFLDLTPLMVASKYGHLEVVRELLTRAADFERRDKKGLDALGHAVAAGHSALIEPLVGRMNAEQRTQALHAALYVASTQNEPDAIAALVAAGADIEGLYTVAVEQTRTPLMLAATGGHVEAAQALLAAGANPNNRIGSSDPLLLAIDAHYRRVVPPETPRRIQLLLALLDAGADATRPQIARKLAIATPPTSYDLEPVIERLLLQGGLPEQSLQILLENALQACHMPLVERIAAAGGQASIERKEPSLLLGAVNCGQIAVVDYLVQRGYAVDQRLSLRQDTPLIRATQNGDVDLAEYLLALHADPALVDADGRDARTAALEHSQLRIVKMLRELQR